MTEYNSNRLSEQDKEERNSRVNNEYYGYPTPEAYELAKKLEELQKEKEELKEGKSKLKEIACLCPIYNPYQFGIEDVIPKVARLAETTPLRYGEVLWVCEEYGEGYKELIQKHIKAGTTHSVFDEIVAEIRARKVIRLLEQEKLAEEIDKQPVINLNERISRTKRKEDKLPRKLRAGWKVYE